ncbi:MAG: hypothetical protein JXA73_03855 [Acidobacteria bacterium]|nr:hypothetical protein [Acidobacteriota bacterium]
MIDPSSAQSVRENLLYIRKTLEAAGQITAVPGRGLIAAGFLSVAGSFINGFVTGAPWDSGPHPQWALAVWGIILAISIAVISIGIYRKSRQTCSPIQAPLLRKLLWSLCPALFIGGLFTDLAIRSQRLDWLPVIWLGCYGAAIANGGQVSVAPVRYMGLSFLLAAAGAALSTPKAGLIWLALGFGWLHLVYGSYIARRHNG